MNSLGVLVLATAVLVMIPGPNVALIVANSLRYGIRMGVMTVVGTTAGVAAQLALVVIGLAAVVEFAADTLVWIRWAGVVYLVWLGIRMWREPVAESQEVEAAPAMFCRGCLLAVLNPKILLFNAAFVPQFVGDGSTAQFALVATVFVGVLFVGDVLWALFANSARQLLRRNALWRNRITGIFLAAAGIGLAFSRR
ncbi:MAG: LysE family translocator [Proteobacteria bacterium]|nr:LysE family translocator [Pseudomonadota bacterium]